MSWGIVASVGVGLLSANAQKKAGQSSKTERVEMDPAMRPYIFGEEGGQKGLLNYNQEQLARAQSPERQAMWGNMMNRGQSLLGGSVAGNPFSAGYTGGTNFGAVGAGMAGNGIPQYNPQPLAPPTTQAPAPQVSIPTMEEIMAEWERRQREQQQAMAGMDYGNGGPGNGGGDGGGPGAGGSW